MIDINRLFKRLSEIQASGTFEAGVQIAMIETKEEINNQTNEFLAELEKMKIYREKDYNDGIDAVIAAIKLRTKL